MFRGVCRHGDPRYRMLRIVPDHGVFFEFVPISEFDNQHGKLKSSHPVRHTLADVVPGIRYGQLLVSGLCRPLELPHRRHDHFRTTQPAADPLRRAEPSTSYRPLASI